MVAHNTINYMKLIARDLIGHDLMGAPYTPHGATHPTEWLMYAGPDADRLAHHMEAFGYTVTFHGGGTIGVSGTPTNVERIRALEIKQAEKQIAWLWTADPDVILQRAARL